VTIANLRLVPGSFAKSELTKFQRHPLELDVLLKAAEYCLIGSGLTQRTRPGAAEHRVLPGFQEPNYLGLSSWRSVFEAQHYCADGALSFGERAWRERRCNPGSKPIIKVLQKGNFSNSPRISPDNLSV
jgi:hypothetical protein